LAATDTVAVVLPNFSGDTPADATSACGNAQPSFAKSSSGASYTVTATIGTGGFDSSSTKCVLKFSGVTNPSSAVTPAYTILITDVAGNQVKTMGSGTAVDTKAAVVAGAPFTVSADVIALADKAASASGVITVEFNAGALAATDTVAVVLPNFSGDTPADATSACGNAQPSFAKSSSGASYTVTATIGTGGFDSSSTKCVLKFSGVTNPSAVGSPTYTILITDVAGNQVKTMATPDTIETATAAAIVPADATFSANPADSSGTITATTTVTLASTGSSHVCYTVDGSTAPDCDGTGCASNKGTKGTSVSVTATTTIKAIGCGGAGNGDSDVSEKAYTWTAANPTISPAAGNVAADSAVTLTSAGSANICYTWTGTDPACNADGTCANSTTYNATAKPTVSATSTLKAKGCAGTGKTDSAVVSAAYTVNVTATTTAAPAAPAATTISGASTGAVWSAMVTVLALMGVSAML